MMNTAITMTKSNIQTFVLAGNATFTLFSVKTEQRYTYKVKVDKKNATRFFVSVLFGPDNENDYRYLGWFYADTYEPYRLLTSSKSCASKDDQRVRFMSQFLILLFNTATPLPDTCKFYPSGRCGRCGRTLTTPESIERGLGPECANY